MNLRTKVLICGAGPTGLLMACQLKRFGIECIIIDEKAGIVAESRALAVQARTLLIYEQMGIIEQVLKQGIRAEKVKIIVNARRLYEVPLSHLGSGLSDYAFLFVLEQNKNEKILYDHLIETGGTVLWQHTLEQFTQDENGVSARVRDVDGEQKEIIADWLVGADGSKSRVRHQLQIPFAGDTYENIFYVADTAAQWPWGHDCLCLCLSEKTFTALFPLKGNNRFRLIGIFPKEFQHENVTDFSVIKNTVETQLQMNVTFTDTNWFSIYRVHHRCVNNFSHQRVFLAGDAAHIHSPVGGQGMNTGLQDAYNLAWKLSMVIKSTASTELLKSYNEERLRVAQRLVKTTDRAFSVVTSQKWFQKFFRLHIFPRIITGLFKFKSAGRFFFKGVSQIGINYSHSSLSVSADKELLKAGALVPFVKLNASKIDEYLKFTGFTIFLFNVTITEQKKHELQQCYHAEFQFVFVPVNNLNADAYRKFKVKSSAVFLVRPDNYIGFADKNFSIERLREYLEINVHLLATNE
jgi:2-polyprenyl-6-methoxyphenol hydroxylase-like FAD-dependent oxidoreductase